MTPLFEKLNYKGQTPLVVLNAPESFEPELAALAAPSVVRDSSLVADPPFLLAFVTRLDEIDRIAPLVGAASASDPVIWFAYPKGTSKRYTCEFNRDTGWAALGALGFEPVRQVAIDADWSALRFRRASQIKSMVRDQKRRISEEGTPGAG